MENDANPPSTIVGVQPVGTASIDDAGVLVIGELMSRLEAALERGVDESAIEEVSNSAPVDVELLLMSSGDAIARLDAEANADPMFELAIADPDTEALRIIAEVTEATNEAAVEIAPTLTAEEPGVTEVSGFISRSPIDRPASVWRLKRRNGVRDAREQVTTSSSAGDVLLSDVYEAKYCFHCIGMLSPLVPILLVPIRIST
jgi:hypothetical protein